MAENDPLEAVRKLGQKVEETFAQIGLRLELFAPIPALHPEQGQPDRVQVIFVCDWEEIGKDEEVRKTEAERQRTNVQFAQMREEAQAAAIREQLAARMQTGASIFDALHETDDAAAAEAAKKRPEEGDPCPNCGDGHLLLKVGLAIVCQDCDFFRQAES